MLLTFTNSQDHDRIQLGDRITLQGVQDGKLRPGRQASMRVVRANNAGEWIAPLNHSCSNGQLKWLGAGSALNHIKRRSCVCDGLVGFAAVV
jgi:aconitate hydratase